MTAKLPSAIEDDPDYPAKLKRPFTEMEALIDLLLKGPKALKQDPYDFSVRWMWDYGMAKSFIKNKAHYLKDASNFITEEEQLKSIAQEVLDIFQEVFDRRAHLNPTRERMIMARVKEGRKMKPPIGPAQFRAVFEFKKKQWTGTEQEKYLRIATLCAPSHFLEYLEEARADYKKNLNKKKEPEGIVLQSKLF